MEKPTLGPVELMAMVFENSDGAAQSLGHLRELEKTRQVQLYNAAVVAKDLEGVTAVQETRDVDAGRGALFGALIGGLVGLLGGPAGVMVGAAAGAATGGVAAHQIDLGFSEAFLNELKNALHPGSSLLMVLVEEQWAATVVQELRTHALRLFPGRLYRNTLRSEVLEKLRQASSSS